MNFFKKYEYSIYVYSLLVLEALFALATLPYVISVLGDKIYGLWIMLFSVCNFLLFTDGGIAGFYLSKIKNEQGENEKKALTFEVKKINIFYILSIPIFIFIVFFISGTTSIELQNLILLLSAFLIPLQLVNNNNEAIFIGYGKEVLAKQITIASVFIQYALMLYLLYRFNTIFALPVSLLARFLFVLIFQQIFFYKKKIHQIKKANISNDVKQAYRINIFGKLFSATNTNAFLVLLGLAYSPEYATYILIALKLCQLFMTIIDRMNIVILPRIIEDTSRFNIVKAINPITLLLFISITALCIAYINDIFVSVWFQNKYTYDFGLLALIAAFFVGGSFSNLLSYQLVALKIFERSSKYTTIENLLKLIFLGLIFVSFKAYLTAMIIMNFLFILFYVRTWKSLLR